MEIEYIKNIDKYHGFKITPAKFLNFYIQDVLSIAIEAYVNNFFFFVIKVVIIIIKFNITVINVLKMFIHFL